ncbi:MAG: LamB/YcsF family protein, partial [Saprospiraceae bacterium]|nr:LamB/YcsF family protein [Saprospiraceae bacterium]
PGIKIYGMSSSSLAEICQKNDLEYVNEVFSDRKYAYYDRLQSRKEQGSVMTDINDIYEQLTLLTQNQVKDIHGQVHELKTDSICMHGDTPGAVNIIKQIHQFLKEQDFDIVAPS